MIATAILRGLMPPRPGYLKTTTATFAVGNTFELFSANRVMFSIVCANWFP